ncbi:hypothetical protein ACB092_01G157200 [Castanea dentata]
MLRSILRAATATSSKPKPTLQSSPIPTPPPPQYSFSSARNYSVKNAKSTTATKGKFNKSEEDAAPAEVDAAVSEAQARARRLAMDEKDPTLDSLKSALLEGLPTGMVKEFEDSLRPALLVRQSFLDLREIFAEFKGPKLRKQVVLDGPVSCGKSIALAMLVHWVRDEDWTHGGFFYKNPNTGLWDTPLQAENDFLKWNESHLKQLPCQISDPIPLGEGAGVGQLKDVDNMAMPEGSTLYDLFNTGIKHTHAAVGVVVRLRKELSLVKNIPVLIAIDQCNSWFTFSEYEEAVKVHS